ncbi:MAG: DUF3179 domain-containing protein [Acidobacteriota bacterium]
MKVQRSAWALALMLAVPSCAQVQGRVLNGFKLSNALVPQFEIMEGGAPRDGIPALTDPPRESAESAGHWLQDEDRVMGVALNDEAVAYPLRILGRHEAVNDLVGGTPLLVTYCPLCGTGVVFDPLIQGRRAIFGVSGLLYNSDVLLYDRKTESLFSQLLFRAITGPLQGTDLETLPALTTTWEEWKRLHPDTQVLSRIQPPHFIDYGTDPYAGYHKSRTTMFPVRGDDRTRDAKQLAYLILDGSHKLLVAEETLELPAGDERALYDVEGGIQLEYDPGARRLLARSQSAKPPTVIPGYWFALSAFHPDARRLEAEDLQPTPLPASAGS